ncbi:MAG: glutathione peroxidase [Bacteroidota bacterium]
MKTIILMTAVSVFMLTLVTAQESKKMTEAPFYGFTMKTLEGKDRSLAEYKGKVVMVVNTASFCGYTPQYKDLETLYKQFKDKGFVIIGFPANNFGKQEPGTDKDIAVFCERNYGVSFPMFSKISVKGDDIHPLYKYLTTSTQFKEDIAWNFTKFIIDKNGNVAAKYASKVKPTEKEVTSKIDELLAGK